MENLQITERASSSLKVSFRATGICPPSELRTGEPAQCLPAQNHVSMELGPSGSNSGAVLEFPQKRRSRGQQQPAKSRGKIAVPPGRSISSEDLYGSSTSSEPPTSSISYQEMYMHAAENPMELEDPADGADGPETLTCTDSACVSRNTAVCKHK